MMLGWSDFKPNDFNVNVCVHVYVYVRLFMCLWFIVVVVYSKPKYVPNSRLKFEFQDEFEFYTK